MNNKSIIISIFAVFSTLFAMAFANLTPIVQKQETEVTKLGLSAESPIVVNEKDIRKSEDFIEKYIKDNYRDYTVTFIMVLSNMSDGHTIQKYTLQKEDVENPEKTETLDLYFDVEIAMTEFRKKNAAEIRRRLKNVKVIQE